VRRQGGKEDGEGGKEKEGVHVRSETAATVRKMNLDSNQTRRLQHDTGPHIRIVGSGG
jgi:hypothetical protein